MWFEDAKKWAIEPIRETPQQGDNGDCGAAMLSFFSVMSREWDINALKKIKWSPEVSRGARSMLAKQLDQGNPQLGLDAWLA